MAFDGFVTNAVISELQQCLFNGKITKIYEPDKNEILLGIYVNHIKYALCINISSAHYGAYLTTNTKPNPLNAPNFCMTLRKHLIGFRIKQISCHGLERIITIDLEGYNELNDCITKKLIIELMGKHSNIILINENNIIIDALRHFDTFSGALRNIQPGYEYSIPQANKIDMTQTSIEKILDNIKEEKASFDLSSYVLTYFAGISKQLLKYSMEKLSLNNDLTADNVECFLSYFLKLYQACKQQKVGLIPFDDDFTIEMKEKETPLAVNFFLDDFYLQKELQEEFINYRNSMLNVILNKLKKIKKKLVGIEEKLEECKNVENYQLYGELITSYLYQLSTQHVPFVELQNYYENNEIIKIPLDISLSPADNAKKYFKKYHKLKNTQDIVSKQKIEIEREMNYLESIVYELQLAKNTRELDSIYDEIEGMLISSKREKTKKYHKEELEILKYVIDGFTVLVGKNNQQNDYLTTKFANAEDIWFHTQDVHGSHVILKTEGKTPTQEIINQVAAIAAHYSKAGQSSNVPVDYTYVKYVKKPSKSKPGMVIYTHQQTVNVVPKI